MVEAIESWAIVELMDYRRRAGRITLVGPYATKLLQVDIPMPDGSFVTEQYGGQAIYAIRPATEEIARDWVQRYGDPRPVSPLAYRLPVATPDVSEIGDDADDVGF